MTAQYLQVSTIDRIATITLNRPEKRNAMHAGLLKELLQTLIAYAEQKHVHVLLINGNGDHFCAGADIAWMQKVSSLSYSENYDDAQLLADVMYRLYTFPKPTIVLAQGAVMGGGLGLIAACDIAFASHTAFFAFSEIKIGLTPATISPYVIAAIGERAAHYYFLTGDKFDAEQAHRLRLIHQITAPQALMSSGVALARQLANYSPSAQTAMKQLIRNVAKEKITSELSQKTAEHLAQIRSSPDAKEGLAAFLEKRTPEWR